MRRIIFFRWLKVIVLLYSVIGISFYYLQNKILFHPKKLAADYIFSFDFPFKELTIPVNSSSSISVLQFYPVDSIRKGVILYFHGNRENIERYAPMAPLMTKSGYEVWMIDYPGFGKSTGKFDEKTLYDWTLQLYKLAEPRFSPDRIIIYGRSLGTGLAAQLASIRNCKQLILETPYYDFRSIVRKWLPVYPLNRMMPFELPTGKYLEKVDVPVIIFHGTEDGVIPYSNSVRLKEVLKSNARFITIEGGSHNDLFEQSNGKFKFPVCMQTLDSLLK
jgi:uncharacterized protein